jgi:5-methylcytosine-specific restriction endonuclease McrA
MTRAVLGFPKVATKRKANHSQRNRTRAHRRVIAELDAIARAEVMERDKCCQRCGATVSSDGTPLQWSHVHSRRHHCLRWDAENSKALCKNCHAWWGYNPGLAYDWFAKKFPERWERITRVLQMNPKVDVKALLAEMRKA